MALAVTFMSVAAVICDEFVADRFDCPEATEPQQERGCVGVLRFAVEPRELEDERRHVICRRGATQKACQGAREVLARFLAGHQHGASKARHCKPQIHAGLFEFLDHFLGCSGLWLAP